MYARTSNTARQSISRTLLPIWTKSIPFESYERAPPLAHLVFRPCRPRARPRYIRPRVPRGRIPFRNRALPGIRSTNYPLFLRTRDDHGPPPTHVTSVLCPRASSPPNRHLAITSDNTIPRRVDRVLNFTHVPFAMKIVKVAIEKNSEIETSGKLLSLSLFLSVCVMWLTWVYNRKKHF